MRIGDGVLVVIGDEVCYWGGVCCFRIGINEGRIEILVYGYCMVFLGIFVFYLGLLVCVVECLGKRLRV